MNKLIKILISASITSLVSLLTVFVFIKLFYNNSDITSPKYMEKIEPYSTDTSVYNPNKYSHYEKEINTLKNEIQFLKKNDSLLKNIEIEASNTKPNMTPIESEIISYIGLVQKHLYSVKNNTLNILEGYYVKLNYYFHIKNLSDDVNRLLMGSMKSVKDKIKSIENNNAKNNQKSNNSGASINNINTGLGSKAQSDSNIHINKPKLKAIDTSKSNNNNNKEMNNIKNVNTLIDSFKSKNDSMTIKIDTLLPIKDSSIHQERK